LATPPPLLPAAAAVAQVSPKMRVEELRNVIRDKGGILPALQRLSYAGA
jgi:hypothetical protein